MVQRVLEGDVAVTRQQGWLELRVAAAGKRSAATPVAVLVLRDCEGAAVPGRLRGARVELELEGRISGRILAGTREFALRARQLDAFDHLPALFLPLHAPFALRRRERWIANLLLKALRLRWGVKLLTGWHVRRTHDRRA